MIPLCPHLDGESLKAFLRPFNEAAAPSKKFAGQDGSSRSKALSDALRRQQRAVDELLRDVEGKPGRGKGEERRRQKNSLTREIGSGLKMQQTSMLAFEEGGLRKRPLGNLLHREATRLSPTALRTLSYF